MYLTRLFIILQYAIMVVYGISVLLDPVSQDVYQGGNVEFICRVRNEEGYRLIWAVDYYPLHVNNSFDYYIFAETNGEVTHTEEGHGSIEVENSTELVGENVIHTLILRKTGVQIADEGHYSCGYENTSWVHYISISSPASLVILVPPSVTPSCSFSPRPVVLHETVTLTCELNDGKPIPSLTWYRGDTPISSTTSGWNNKSFEITEADKGVPFTCFSNGAVLQSTSTNSCTITPLNILPMDNIATSTILIGAASAGVISLLLITIFVTVMNNRRLKQRMRQPRDNARELEDISNINNQLPTQSVSTPNDSGGYVVDSIPLVRRSPNVPSRVTTTSEYPYEIPIEATMSSNIGTLPTPSEGGGYDNQYAEIY